MAGMEQLEIHSKSYLVRWVNVKAEHTISWSIRPDKKSINFGIFKHPGSGQAPTPNLPSSTFEPPSTPNVRPEDAPQEFHSSKNASSTATEKLKSIGLKQVSWYGTCEANRVSTGTYDVAENEGGMYALVFDNTFAKSFAKSATFVLLTYPTGSPPQSNHHMHHIQGGFAENVTCMKDTLNNKKAPMKRESSDSAVQVGPSNSATQRCSDECKNKRQGESENRSGSNFFTGVLQKKRRKKNQGWARRFFSLDYTSSTLSYYQNRRTQAVRGVAPLSMAAIGANAKTRQISIDSGAEIWHLKAANRRDFDAWKQALELARSCVSPTTPASATRLDTHGRSTSAVRTNPEEERDWAKVEDLVAKVRGSRDVAKSLAIDTDPKYLPQTQVHTPIDPALNRVDSAPISAASSTSGSPAEQSLPSGYFAEGDRRPFWKRKPTTDRPMPGMYRSVSATPSTQSVRATPPTPIRTSSFGKTLQSHPEEESLHDRCLSLLRDLDSIVANFGRLIAENKQRRMPVMPPTTSRQSIDTQGDDEFFDAEGGNNSQLLDIHHETEEEGEEADRDFATDEDSASASDVDEPTITGELSAEPGKSTPAFPPKPKSLAPLPAQWVKRRIAVNAPTGTPPSLVSFMRKNVGKDLSTISMPVTANEPISALQRFAEVVEYSTLLDDAANKPRSSIERLIYVTAFAVSSLSNIRVKERAIRKPFNPMLGETFELVREDRGLRFLAEKISHRPVHMAYQAESEHWTLTQSPSPTQKFWGKSAELITEGKTRVILHSTGDRFSWTPGSSFLRNIIAGEKYVEPVGNMTVVNEATGEKAVVTFKAKGMFSGRSEDVAVQTYDSYGDEEPLGLVGRWTSSLTATENGNSRANEPPIWSVAELVPDAAKRYGFTTFAASLNEITPIEKGKLPPTDSRLRPDQRAAEDGDFDEAEVLKGKLEEAQRKRRKILEDGGSSWTPRWFEKVEGGDGSGEEVWVTKAGQDNYWEKRSKSEWEEVEKIFDL
ncbi:MAG: hypothetical protein ALECFALPRED_009301 [Alectoria fallacina]|uniref:PH domain-containing protein n=1 Tax=Alectoria fallacina TaxID=1903189 RepID=A0A8H3PIR2_9LECA|nr:MAG: hypothetical protein ALECFALPRED_009301 [Alectoria fallacina]